VVTRPGKRRAPVRKSRTLGRTLLVGLTSVVMVLGLAGTYFYRELSGNLHVVDLSGQIVGQRPSAIDDGPSGPINILVMGSDTRDCDGCDIDGLTGGGARSDTTILIHLSADRSRAYGISIPRDSIVDRPACKAPDGSIVPAATGQMWNAAYSVGGPACTIAQVEHTTGIRIDHYVVLDFSGFKAMVDAIGGVEVCIPQTWDDRAHGIYLPAGTRTISGKQALAYVRVRHGVGDGSDLGRVKRQQAFIGSMAQAVLSSGTLSNPVKIVRFLDAATKSLTLDPGLGDLRKLGGLAYQFRNIGMSRIKLITVPWMYDPSDPNRVVWTSQVPEVWDAIRYDRPIGKALLSDSINVGNLPGKAAKHRDKDALEQAGLCSA